jgi:hypothetical protein
LQLLTDFVDVHEQHVTRAQPIGVYSFDDEWPSASTCGCARSIDDHDDLFAAVEHRRDITLLKRQVVVLERQVKSVMRRSPSTSSASQASVPELSSSMQLKAASPLK